MQYWDKNGKIHSDNEQNASAQTKAYNFLLSKFKEVNPQDLVMEIAATAVPMTKIKYLPEAISAARLLHHKPFDKMTPKEYSDYGKLGKEYYKKYIQNKPVINEKFGVYDFKGGQAGKPDYRYMEQYPKLRENIENAKDNVYLDVKPYIDDKGNLVTRKDATGFDNLKVNWKGKDFDYQMRHNPFLDTPDFYNIKPYEFLIEEIKKRTP